MKVFSLPRGGLRVRPAMTTSWGQTVMTALSVTGPDGFCLQSFAKSLGTEPDLEKLVLRILKKREGRKDGRLTAIVLNVRNNKMHILFL